MKTKVLNLKDSSKGEQGFSLIELLIVLVVSSVIGAVAFMSVNSSKKFLPDDQSLKILDILQESRQRAINQRAVMRVEINNTRKQIRLIDENKTKSMDATLANDSSDDVEIKKVAFDTKNVVVGVRPSNVLSTKVPTQSSDIPEISFSQTTYPLSANDSVYTMCFLKDGSVVQPLATGLCPSSNSSTGAVIRGVTMYIYSIPNVSTNKAEIIRAIAVTGATSSATVYKCQLDSSKNCGNWVN